MLTLDIAMWNLVVPNVLVGLALGLIFVPLTTAALGTVPDEQIGNATGLPVILEFPTLEDAKRWYDSEEYRPLKALRLGAARVNGFLVQGV